MNPVGKESWAGKAFVVTGGASGIGLAVVHQLLDRSATVHLIDRAKSLPESLKERENGNIYFYGSVDISLRRSVTEVFKQIHERDAHISGLVNSAGTSPSSGGILDTDETYEANMSVNVGGTWNVSTEVLKAIQAQRRDDEEYAWKPRVSGRCSIVNLGSTASYHGYPTMGAYVASKHAVLGLTRTWALDFAPFGVRVNLVAPGITRTPLCAEQFGDGDRGDMSRAMLAKIPLKRLAEPEETADAIMFLLGDGSSFITGQTISVSGGFP